ncbi:MAG: NAD(P)H-hydrate dehydratase [Rhodobacteraceae bacterium]|nr:NAD(P)H-hydrate dehydratase [Paracoccaceae bacterium]
MIILDVLTAAQMRRIELTAFAGGRVTQFDLMELAGRSAADAIDRRYRSRLDVREVHLLCGPGNNGGDGYRAATRLRELGWKVAVWAADIQSAESPASEMRAQWGERGECEPLGALPDAGIKGNPLFVDALFGIGLNRALRPEAAAALAFALRTGPVAAIDLLSGIDADTGCFPQQSEICPAGADFTVTFECAKPGHFLGQGGQLTGELEILPLGLAVERQAQLDTSELIGLWQPSDVPVDLLAKGVAQHKYSHGHVLVVSGPSNHGGAARLAARAALRTGAGLVTVGAPRGALREHAAALDAVMVREMNDPRELTRLLRDRRINVICIGPGLGRDDRARELTLAALDAGRSCVVDADALSAFADTPDQLFGHLDENAVLTPHDGEFARLFRDLAPGLQGEAGGRVEAARIAAARAGATLLLKGACSTIAGAAGRVCLMAATGKHASPWLATAGSGDTLSGIIAGLLAKGAPAGVAAASGAYMLADAARRYGPGFISEDVPAMIPAVLRSLLDRESSAMD